MATRFYLPSSGGPAVAPAFSAAWTLTDSVVRYATSISKAATAQAQENAQETETTNPSQPLVAQYVSPPIAAQTISGTFSAVVRCRETAANMNASLQVLLKVVSGDGSTVRGTLYGGHSAASNAIAGALGQEMFLSTDPSSAGETRIIPAGTALSPVDAQSGDRVVIEIGARAENINTTAYIAVLYVGDNQASDYALTAGLSSVVNPWVELSDDINWNLGPVILPSRHTGSLTAELNRLAGTTGLAEAGAANAWAGTTGLATQGALNAKNGTFGVAIQGVCNQLAGTSGLAAPEALARYGEV